MYNPCIRGWINYYSNFYRTQLRSTLKRIDLYVIRWARRKFKRLRLKTKGARDWFEFGFAAQIRRSSLIGSCAMETAEHREPCELRGSRTDLGAPGRGTSGRLHAPAIRDPTAQIYNRRARPSRSVMSSSKDSGPPLMPSATASRVTDP